MIEKNVVGVYNLREYYPIFAHEDLDEKRIDPVKYAPEKTAQLDPARGEISPHESPWKNFSDFLHREKRQSSRQAKPSNPARAVHEGEDTLSPNFTQAQAKVDQAIAAHIHNKFIVPPAPKMPDKRQVLAKLQKQLPSPAQVPLKIHETPDISHGKSAVGGLTLQKVMSRRVVCIFEDAPIHQMLQICHDRHISGLPVIGLDKKLKGVISLSDMMPHLFAQGLAHQADSTSLLTPFWAQAVSQYMQTQVIHAPPETLVRDACRQMLACHVRRLIVTERGEVRGVFSAQDAVKLLSQTQLKIQK